MKKLYAALLLAGLSAQAQIVNIPDPHLKYELLMASPNYGIARDINGQTITIDTNNNNEIEMSEAVLVDELLLFYVDNITDLTGIGAFANMRHFEIAHAAITTFDATGLTGIEFLRVDQTDLASINIAGLLNLKKIYITDNPITAMDLTGAPNLERVEVSNNELTSVNLSGLDALQLLYCQSNDLTAIDLTGLTALKLLMVSNNHINVLDVSQLPNLEQLFCSQNSLENLNLNGLANLTRVNCAINQLEYILFKDTGYTGAATDYFEFDLNPNIQYICTNESKIALIEGIAISYGYTGCDVIADCALGSQEQMALNFDVYPNPAHDRISISGATNDVVAIKIYNILGQAASEPKLVQNSADISYLSPGQYIIKISDGTRVYTAKLIKD
jgi:hypothetical protein